MSAKSARPSVTVAATLDPAPRCPPGYYRRLFEITWQLIVKDLKAKYKSHFLGYLWSIGTPLLLAFIMNFAFRQVLRIQVEDYPLFLVSTLFAWQWFSVVTISASGVFLANASIIKKVYFPRYLIPLSITLIEAFHYLLALPVIGVFLLLHDRPLWRPDWWYGIPLLMCIQIILCLGLALLVGSLNTLFRDLERVIGLLITLLFYLTPILYPTAMIPKDLAVYLQFNPVLDLIEAWRQLLMHGELLWPAVGGAALHALFTLGIGVAVYRALSPRFAEVL